MKQQIVGILASIVGLAIVTRLVLPLDPQPTTKVIKEMGTFMQGSFAKLLGLDDDTDTNDKEPPFGPYEYPKSIPPTEPQPRIRPRKEILDL